jgi:hypothetical protein
LAQAHAHVVRRPRQKQALRVGPRPPASEVPWGDDTRFSVSLDALDAVLQTVGYKCVTTEGIRVEHLEFKLDAPPAAKVIVKIVDEHGKTPVLCRFCPSRQAACSHCGDIYHVRLRARQQEQPVEEGAQPDGEDIEEAGDRGAEEEAHEEEDDDGSHDADDDEDDDDGDEADDDEEGDGSDRKEEEDDEESKEEGARGDVAAADDDDGNGGPQRPHNADDDYRKEEDERAEGVYLDTAAYCCGLMVNHGGVRAADLVLKCLTRPGGPSASLEIYTHAEPCSAEQHGSDQAAKATALGTCAGQQGQQEGQTRPAYNERAPRSGAGCSEAAAQVRPDSCEREDG